MNFSDCHNVLIRWNDADIHDTLKDNHPFRVIPACFHFWKIEWYGWLTGVILPNVTYFSWFSDPPTDSRWRHQYTALKSWYFASSLKNNKNICFFFFPPRNNKQMFQSRFFKNNNKWKRNLFCAGISPNLSPSLDDGWIGRCLIEQLLICCVCAHENAQHLQLAR